MKSSKTLKFLIKKKFSFEYKFFLNVFLFFYENKTLFFYAKKMCTNFCRTIKFFSENDALESFFKSHGSLIERYQVIKFSTKKKE